MAIDFKKWNEEFGGEKAVKELEEAKKNEYKEVPDGNYTCTLEKLELAASKAGKPMVKGMFRIKEGKYKKQCLFINQVMTPGFPTHKALEFLREMDVIDPKEIDFDGNFENFNDLLLDIAEAAEGVKFDVNKTTEDKYTRLRIDDTFD